MEFPGSTQLAAQLDSVQVREIDEIGSLELVNVSGPAAMVKGRVPVEGLLLDADGIEVHLLLHVVNGRLHELEIYKDDGSKPFDPPDADLMTVEIA